MVVAHLHPACRDSPCRLVAVRSNSFHSAARSSPGRTNTMGASFIAASVVRLTCVTIDYPQKLAHLRGISNRRAIGHGEWSQRSSKVCRDRAQPGPWQSRIAERDCCLVLYAVSCLPRASIRQITCSTSGAVNEATGLLPIRDTEGHSESTALFQASSVRTVASPATLLRWP